MGRRRKLREHILKLLYQWEVNKNSPEEVFDLYFQDEKLDQDGAHFVKGIFFGVCEKVSSLDEKIERVAQNWKLNRIAVIDRSLIRMALFEMLHREDIPLVVSINEAVDIAKKYSTADSGKFVNGILDRIKNELAEEGS